MNADGAPPGYGLEVMTRALLGGRTTGPDGKRRTHGWIDQIPKDISVVVGHEVIEEGKMTERTGKAGGRAIFADTGGWRSDKGHLACMDIPIDELFPGGAA